MKEFVVDTISRETLKDYGLDSSNVSDETMKEIANVLRFTFRECVLVELPQIAEDYNISQSPKQYHEMSITYKSLICEEGNSHYSKRFYNNEDAITQFRKVRDEEMKRLKDSGYEYEIENDDDDFFKVYWSGKREMMSISMN